MDEWTTTKQNEVETDKLLTPAQKVVRKIIVLTNSYDKRTCEYEASYNCAMPAKEIDDDALVSLSTFIEEIKIEGRLEVLNDFPNQRLIGAIEALKDLKEVMETDNSEWEEWETIKYLKNKIEELEAQTKK